MHDAARTPLLGIPSAVALLAGVSACLWSPVLSPWWLSAALLMAGAWAMRRGARRANRIALVGGWFLAGAALAGLHAAYVLSQQLPAHPLRHDAVVTGRIVSLPEHEPRRTSFLFRVDGDVADPRLRDRLVRLSWYDDDPVARGALRAGERWRFSARLRAPRGLRNPGGVDAERYALAQRIAATGYLRDPSSARRLAMARGLDAWRDAMSMRIAAKAQRPASRFVRALALGDVRGIRDDDWSVLRANGLTHLIAISGFHVGLVAGAFALLARALWWCRPTLARRMPAPVAAAGAGAVGALLYAAVAGFALPTVRTALMIALVAAVKASRRSLGVADGLALAAMAVLLADPLSVLGAGFWLSFAGVAWLVWCLPSQRGGVVREFFGAQAVATIGLLPVSVVLFGQASVAGLVANLVAVPWWSLVVVPLSLVGLALEAMGAGMGQWAWTAAAWCFDLAWPLFERLADGPLALWWLPEPHWMALPLALIGAFWLLLPRGVPGKVVATLLWLPLLWPDRRTPAHGEAELLVVDVGQGLSVVVRTSHHALLFDMGPAVPEGFDAGERAVVPALHALGVVRLDRVIVSHSDNDHMGGLGAVREAYPIPMVMAPSGAPVDGSRPCQAGERWRWDGVEFRFLHPPRDFPYLGNESSCVLRIEVGGRAALLTGDIGEVIERRLLRLAPGDVKADVVLVAHHGSAGSSDPAFVAATGAVEAFVSAGHGNRFGHPREEVVRRWSDAGARVHETAREGALRVRLGGDGVSVEARREAHPNLWDAAHLGGTHPAGLSYRPD